MPQHDYDLANNPGAVFRADANDVLDAIATNNSGTTAPAITFAHQWWFDESVGDLMQRNTANTGWVAVARKDINGWTPYLRGVLMPPVTGAQILTGESGTKTSFQQDNAPIGWIKDTTHNNKAFRLVSGTPTTGGSLPFTTVFGSGKTTFGHAVSIAQLAQHAHTLSEILKYGANQGGAESGTGSSFGSIDPEPLEVTQSAGSGATHAHNLNMDIQFVDFILCTRD